MASSCYRRPGFSPTVVSRRIFRRLSYKNENRYESVVLVQGVPCPRVTLLQIWERSVVAKRREQAKTSRSERPRRRHLDDGSCVKGSIAKCCCFYRWACVLTRWGSWVSIPKLLAPDGVVVLNICSATTHLIIPRPPPELLRLKSSWTIIFLVSPQIKLQISLLTLPATKCNKHVSVVNNRCVTSITSWYVCIFFPFFSACICLNIYI